MTSFWSAALLATAILSLICILYVVPAALRSLFRLRVWELIDEVVSGVANGTIPRKEGTEFIDGVYSMTDRPKSVTPIGVLAIHLAGRSMDPNLKRKLRDLETHPALEPYEKRVMQLLVNHAMFETVSGWVLLIPVIAATIVLLFIPPLRHWVDQKVEAIEEHVTDDVLTVPRTPGTPRLAPVRV